MSTNDEHVSSSAAKGQSWKAGAIYGVDLKDVKSSSIQSIKKFLTKQGSTFSNVELQQASYSMVVAFDFHES